MRRAPGPGDDDLQPAIGRVARQGAPGDGREEHRVRFALTSEAGLNDALAFPFVHLALDRSVVGIAEGWNPDTWRPIAENLADMMSWTAPTMVKTGDPAPYAGTPAVPARS